MIVPQSGVRVLVATKPVDFRKGIDGLAALVQEHLRLDPFTGTVFVFRPKRADRVKLLVWDGNGLVMIYKRLDEGKFRWPHAWFTDTLTKLINHWPQSRIDELMPWAYADTVKV